jgi:hypothetical protein
MNNVKHRDDIAVENFAISMSEKMKQSREKGRAGWDNPSLCSAELLSNMLRMHVAKGDPVDVANFCMMLHQRGERITPRDCVKLAFESWAHEKGFCLDKTFMNSTGVPDNPYENGDTKMAFEIWIAATKAEYVAPV